MPHFAEISIGDVGLEYLDLDKVYRIRVFERPPTEGGTFVEVYFLGMTSPLTFSQQQAADFLDRFHKWAGPIS